MSSNDKLQPKVALGVAAHPDDLDFGASGTFAKWASRGTKVYYLILTDGSKGSPDLNISSPELVKIREEEQRAAAKILGVKNVFFAGHEDGALVCDIDVKKDIARVIRQVKPEVVITMDPTFVYSAERGFINHPDHRAAGQATLDAVFPLARDHLSFPDLYADGLQPHKVSTILLNNFNKTNFAVDISDTIELKMKALAAHASQMPDIDSTQKFMRANAAEAGKKYDFTYAEEFLRIDIQD